MLCFFLLFLFFPSFFLFFFSFPPPLFPPSSVPKTARGKEKNKSTHHSHLFEYLSKFHCWRELRRISGILLTPFLSCCLCVCVLLTDTSSFRSGANSRQSLQRGQAFVFLEFWCFFFFQQDVCCRFCIQKYLPCNVNPYLPLLSVCSFASFGLFFFPPSFFSAVRKGFWILS